MIISCDMKIKTNNNGKPPQEVDNEDMAKVKVPTKPCSHEKIDEEQGEENVECLCCPMHFNTFNPYTH
jgi:hypothetical protein